MNQLSQPRALVLSARVPYPPIGGDLQRIFNTAKILSSAFDVDLLTLAPLGGEDATEGLRSVFCRVAAFPISRLTLYANASKHVATGRSVVSRYELGRIKRWMQDYLPRYDLVYCNYVHMAPYALAVGGCKVIDLVDAISLHYREAGKFIRGLRKFIYRIDQPRLCSFERDMLTLFNLAFISSPVDRDYMLQGAPSGCCPIVVMPTGVREGLLDRPGARREHPWIVFLGKMDYYPNEQAALYFAREVLPLIRRHHENVRFVVVGANPGRRIRELMKVEGIDVTGSVSSPESYVERATVVVAPMRIASGIQNKVIEAMALGKAVVTTPLAVRGIPRGRAGEHFVTADTPATMATAVVDLLRNEERRRSLGRAARRLVKEEYNWETIGQRFLTEIDRVLQRWCAASEHC